MDISSSDSLLEKQRGEEVQGRVKKSLCFFCFIFLSGIQCIIHIEAKKKGTRRAGALVGGYTINVTMESVIERKAPEKPNH